MKFHLYQKKSIKQGGWFFLTAFLLCCMTLPNLNAQTVFWQEDFETDGTGTRYKMDNQFKDGSSDFFGHIESTGPSSFQFVGCVTENISLLSNPSGFSGSFFIAGEDMNDTGGECDPTAGGTGAAEQRNIDFSGAHAINIAGASTMTFKFLLAATAPTGCDASDYDFSPSTGLTDGLQVFYSIDGGAEVLAIRFSPDINCDPGDQSNETLYHDLNMDGDGNTGSGPQVEGGAMINNVFQEFSFTIPSGGSSLALRVEFTTGTGDEEILVDNLRLEAVTHPSSGVYICDDTDDLIADIQAAGLATQWTTMLVATANIFSDNYENGASSMLTGHIANSFNAAVAKILVMGNMTAGQAADFTAQMTAMQDAIVNGDVAGSCAQ